MNSEQYLLKELIINNSRKQYLMSRMFSMGSCRRLLASAAAPSARLAASISENAVLELAASLFLLTALLMVFLTCMEHKRGISGTPRDYRAKQGVKGLQMFSYTLLVRFI